MSKVVYLGDIPFVIPEQGANPKDFFWGQNISEWIEEASDRINTFSFLISETSQLLNNEESNTPINLLTFDPTLYRRIEIEFAIVRGTARESGYMILMSTGSSWDYTLEYDSVTPTDIVLDVSGSSVVYSSGTAVGTSTIRFRATGISA